MLYKIFEELDHKILTTNQELRAEGALEIPHFFIKVLGQTALIEASIELNLFATVDVDAYANFNWLAKSLFSEVLSKYGLFYDELSSEIWMPKETEYLSYFKGKSFESYLARAEYILLSKLLKAPEKNRILLLEYLAKGASDLFLNLCAQYQVDLEDFLNHV